MAQHDVSGAQTKGDLLHRIQERYGSLRKSERIVADYLRNRPGTRLDASITELGRTLGVSEATISRVSRALGYEGFPDMKLSLAEGARSRNSFANIPMEIDENDSLVTTSGKLASLLCASLQGTQRLLDGERIERAVEALHRGRKIVFVGVGGAASICDEAAHLFIKAGIDAVSYSDGYTQTIAAATMTPDKVMLGVSHTGTTETVATALQLSREKGATTIAITSDATSSVAKAADIVLTTWNSATPLIPLYGDFLEGRISQLFLIDLLYLGLLFRAGEETGRNLKATGSALEKHYMRKAPDER
ncbi:MAG: putative Sialic acid utilization regulator, RpiR family [Xanthobacteraceae bacterium]|jgi:RpiR family carbohydrate utilization transcriptional regulator|nr:putative Sialic acid utilization regulator, RpiR family [Xanthobacteraceae bacterium]